MALILLPARDIARMHSLSVISMYFPKTKQLPNKFNYHISTLSLCMRSYVVNEQLHLACLCFVSDENLVSVTSKYHWSMFMAREDQKNKNNPIVCNRNPIWTPLVINVQYTILILFLIHLSSLLPVSSFRCSPFFFLLTPASVTRIFSVLLIFLIPSICPFFLSSPLLFTSSSSFHLPFFY